MARAGRGWTSCLKAKKNKKLSTIGKFDKGYEAMGYIIIASSVFSIFMRIKGQKTMFGTLEDQ